MAKDYRSKKDSGKGGAPGWMATFSDLMSLLLTFFILLFSMSNVDEEKFDNLSQSIQGVLGGIGILENETVIIKKGQDGTLDIQKESSLTEEMKKELDAYIEQKGIQDDVEIIAGEEGVFVDIKEATLFDTGSAKIKDSGKRVLDELADMITDIENPIMIEGHTDNVPINNAKYSSNWELSTARSISVVKYYTDKYNVTPGRMSAIGYGEYKPIAKNDTPEHRAMNRRVNILIIIDESGAKKDGKQQ